MSTNSCRALLFTVITGGLMLLGATTANASETNGADSLGGGNQVEPSIIVPVDLTGTTAAAFGDATSTSATTGSNGGTTGAENGSATDGSHSVLGGNQIAPEVSAPVDSSGTTIGALGDAGSTGTTTGSTSGTTGTTGQGDTTDGSHSILGGNQIAPQVTVPVDSSGTTIGALGDASS